MTKIWNTCTGILFELDRQLICENDTQVKNVSEDNLRNLVGFYVTKNSFEMKNCNKNTDQALLVC